MWLKNGDLCVKKGFLGGRWIAGFASLVVDWVDVDWVFNQVQGGQEVRNPWSLDIGKIKGQKNGEGVNGNVMTILLRHSSGN